jgi:Uma2 family endonuclease
MPVQRGPLVSVEEYLSSSYEGDRDYVDGVLEERNWGDYDHSRLHTGLLCYLANRRRQWNVYVLPSLRTRIGPTRFRIPDLCVFPRGQEIEQIPTKPPLLCIEVLSPEDKWSHFEKHIQDFLTMGVERVWVFDAQERDVFECTKSGRRLVLEDLLEAPPVSIRISELMAELD